MSVAVVLPAGSYRVGDTEVALPQQLLLLPAPDTHSVVKSFSALSIIASSVIVISSYVTFILKSFLSCTLLSCTSIQVSVIPDGHFPKLLNHWWCCCS